MSFFYKKYRYFYPSAFEDAHDPFYAKASWKLCFAWLPHYCEISNERIWFKKGYQGQRFIVMTDDDEPIIEERWHSIECHKLWKKRK